MEHEKWNALKLLSPFQQVRIRGITVDHNDNVYFTIGDQGLWTLSKKDGKPKFLAKLGDDYMFGVAFDKKNSLYICEDQRILQYNMETNVLSVLCGSDTAFETRDGKLSEASVFTPWGIAIDMNGDLLVSEPTHIRKISLTQSMVTTIAGTELGYEDGSTYIAKFRDLCGIAVDTDGTIFLCDAGSRCIRKIKDGIVSTVAGKTLLSNQTDVLKDGTLLEAVFALPTDLVIDQDGSLLIVDQNFLRRVDIKNNTVCTIWKSQVVEQVIASDSKGHLYIGSYQISKLKDTWQYARFLWIAKLKEDPSYCMWASLPVELVREVTSQIRSSRTCHTSFTE